MTDLKKVTYLSASILAIIFLPWLGSYINFSGVFPPHFFDYPMLAPMSKSGFSWPVFIVCICLFIGVIALYVFPSLFGFKQQPIEPRKPVVKVKWPIWFWIGLFFWGSALFLLWTKATAPKWYLHWSDMPLFWGFVLMLDGWVYVRNGGKSLIRNVPQEIVAIGIVSAGGWMLFEYLNFFVHFDWYYPFGNIISQEQFLLYAILISSGLLTVAFEWYSLFQTFPIFKNRFSNGIKIIIPEKLKNYLIYLSLFFLIASGIWPNIFFWSLWLAPALLLALVIDKCGVWSPLRAIGQGNWNPVLVFALTYFCAGLVLECQNYFSAIHAADRTITFTTAPAYWQYDLPYINDFHLFEMPVVGFMGYLPFSGYCWLWWIACATIMGIDSKFFKEEPLEPNYVK